MMPCAGGAPRLGSLGWWLALGAVVVVVPLYWPTLRYDLFSDDYFLLRPWPPQHLLDVLTGPWVPWARQPVYYRPIAIYIYEIAFFLFGLNTTWLHVVPMITIAGVAWLLGWFVWRATASRAMAVAASMLYALHPATTNAGGPFIANQYQGVATGLVLATLIWWQHCRTRPLLYWLPLALSIMLAAFTKENGLLLPGVLILLHHAHARWLHDLPAPSRGAVMGAAALFVLLFGWRWIALNGLGGQSEPWPWGEVPVNGLRLAYYLIGRPSPFAPWPWAYGAVSVALFLIGLTALGRRQLPEARLVLTGGVILAVTALPLLLLVSRDRPYEPALGVTLIHLGGLAAIARWSTTRRRWRAVVPALLAGAVAAALSTRSIIGAFSPCHPHELRGVASYVDVGPDLPPEMRGWMADRLMTVDTCRADSYVPLFRAVPTLTWGVVDAGTDGGAETVYRWTASRVVALVTERAGVVSISLRNAAASQAHPVEIRISANSRPAGVVRLHTGEWAHVKIALGPSWRSRLRQMHQIELVTDDRWTGDLLLRPLAVSPDGGA